MKVLLFAFFAAGLISGCSATWNGVQQDTERAVDWTKGQVNQGASYIKEKTE